VIHFRLAELQTELELLRAMTYQAADTMVRSGSAFCDLAGSIATSQHMMHSFICFDARFYGTHVCTNAHKHIFTVHVLAAFKRKQEQAFAMWLSEA
jgi:alkylation response protein AidB-like acyl-CoA dehydrogenase